MVITTEEFIKRAKEIHGDKYDYSKTIYKNRRTKLIITCPKHGDFEQRPDAHLSGQGCPKCAIETTHKKISKTTEEFKKEIYLKFGNKYNYNAINYLNNETKVDIICPEHGIFSITPNVLLLSKYGCPKCAIEKNSEKKKLTTEEFIKRAKEVHGNKYDYSLVKYSDSRIKVKIICSKHGEFEQIPNTHLNGSGCPKCRVSKGEKEIENYLTSNKILFETQKKFDDLMDKKQLSYDFFLPNENLLIEYNGEQHYINTSFKNHNLKLQKHHDWLKRKYAEKHEINLLTIPYWKDTVETLNIFFNTFSLLFLEKTAAENNLQYFYNENNDLEIKDHNLVFHLANLLNGETDSVKRWEYYNNLNKRCVFVYPPYLNNKNKINIYKNILLYHCGIRKKIYARNTIVKIFNAIETKKFFEENNIEGYRSAKKAYALIDKKTNEILMVYSVGHAFFGNGKYDLEIARGACKLGYQIIGGASKLWKAILNDNPNTKSIVYYVDRREYDGRSIKKLMEGSLLNGKIINLKGTSSFMNYWKNNTYIGNNLWHKKGDYTNREPLKNKEVVNAYKNGDAIAIKNPGSFVNIFIRND